MTEQKKPNFEEKESSNPEFVLPPATCFIREFEGNEEIHTISVILTRPHAFDQFIGKTAKVQIEKESWINTGSYDEEDHSQVIRELKGIIIGFNEHGIIFEVESGTIHYDTNADLPARPETIKISFLDEEFHLQKYANVVQLTQIKINGQNILEDIWDKYDKFVYFGSKKTESYLFDKGPYVTWKIGLPGKNESATALKTRDSEQLQQFIGERADITVVDKRFAYLEDTPVKITTTKLTGTLITINEFGVTIRADGGEIRCSTDSSVEKVIPGDFLFAYEENLHEEDVLDKNIKISEFLVNNRNILPQEFLIQNIITFN